MDTVFELAMLIECGKSSQGLSALKYWCVAPLFCLLFKIDTPFGSVAWSDQRPKLPGLGEGMPEALQGPVSPELCLSHSWPCLLLGMCSGAWKDAVLVPGSVVPGCALSWARVCTA